METEKSLTETLDEISKTFNEVFAEIEKEQEEFWNSLSKEEQLKAFCAVSRRIFEGEIKQKGTYRYVLYQVFGFDASAYGQAQMAGYLSIHNAIVDENYDTRLLQAFCKKFNIEEADSKISNWLL